jgi:hypothetical protein
MRAALAPGSAAEDGRAAAARRTPLEKGRGSCNERAIGGLTVRRSSMLGRPADWLLRVMGGRLGRRGSPWRRCAIASWSRAVATPAARRWLSGARAAPTLLQWISP